MFFLPAVPIAEAQPGAAPADPSRIHGSAPAPRRRSPRHHYLAEGCREPRPHPRGWRATMPNSIVIAALLAHAAGRIVLRAHIYVGRVRRLDAQAVPAGIL